MTRIKTVWRNLTTAHGLSVGDKVIYTNDQGVCLGEKTITKIERGVQAPPYHNVDPVYFYITPTDAPWAPKRLKNLRKVAQ